MRVEAEVFTIMIRILENFKPSQALYLCHFIDVIRSSTYIFIELNVSFQVEPIDGIYVRLR